MRVNKEHYLYLFVFLTFAFCNGCGLTNVGLTKPPRYLTPVTENKPVLYISTFEDARTSKKIGKHGALGIIPTYTKDNILEITADTFVDVLIKNNINACSYNTTRNHMEKNDLLIEGKVTDFIYRWPWSHPMFPVKCKAGIEMKLIDATGEVQLTKEYLNEYEIPRSLTVKIGGYQDEKYFDVALRNLFQEIISDEEFKGAIAVLEMFNDQKMN